MSENHVNGVAGADALAGNKSAIVQHIHDTHRQEINAHREAMLNSVQWCTNVFLAIAGGLLLLGSSNWRSLGTAGLWFGTVSVLVIVSFVVAQLLHSADAINSNARIVVKTDEFMGLFSKSFYLEGTELYPLSWRQWGQSKKAGYYEKFHIALVVLLAAALVVFMWLL